MNRFSLRPMPLPLIHRSVPLRPAPARFGETRRVSGGRWHRYPLVFVFALIGAANAFVYLVRLNEPVPLSPWEPAVAMEAIRFAERLPLYETSHATHMYGPLLTVAIAAIFKISGFNLIAARIVFSVVGVALAGFLATLLCRGERRGWWVPAFILFAAVNLRTGFSMVSAQAEGVAAFLALIALWLWARPKSSRILRVVAILLFLAAVMFKQTAAAFALILPAKMLLCGRPFDWRKLLLASMPAIAIALLIVVIHQTMPALFLAMIAVPASIHVSLVRAASGTILLLSTFPVFYVGTAALLLKQERFSETDRWILSSIAVLLPAAIWTFAKSGGSSNSFLYAYLAMTALLTSHLPSIIEWVESLPAPRIFPATFVLSVAFFCSYFFQFDQSLALLSLRHGDEKIEDAIEIAHRVGPGVISPEDPSIAYRANGYLGRSIFFELDAHTTDGEWPSALPIELNRELDHARGVIEVSGYIPLPIFRRTLMEKRFRPVIVPVLERSAYTLWMKSGKQD